MNQQTNVYVFFFLFLVITFTRDKDNRTGGNHGRSDSYHLLGFQRESSKKKLVRT